MGWDVYISCKDCKGFTDLYHHSAGGNYVEVIDAMKFIMKHDHECGGDFETIHENTLDDIIYKQRPGNYNFVYTDKPAYRDISPELDYHFPNSADWAKGHDEYERCRAIEDAYAKTIGEKHLYPSDTPYSDKGKAQKDEFYKDLGEAYTLKEEDKPKVWSDDEETWV